MTKTCLVDLMILFDFIATHKLWQSKIVQPKWTYTSQVLYTKLYLTWDTVENLFDIANGHCYRYAYQVHIIINFPGHTNRLQLAIPRRKFFFCEFDALIFTPSTFHRLAPSVILWAKVYSIDRGNRDNNNNNITQKNRQYSNYNMCPVRLKCINQTCLSYPWRWLNCFICTSNQ